MRRSYKTLILFLVGNGGKNAFGHLIGLNAHKPTRRIVILKGRKTNIICPKDFMFLSNVYQLFNKKLNPIVYLNKCKHHFLVQMTDLWPNLTKYNWIHACHRVVIILT